MLPNKDNTILSEINGFFGSSEKALNTIFRVTRSLSLSRNSVLKSAKNNTYQNCDKLILLLLFPFFQVKDAFHYKSSALDKFMSCGKDVFYRIMNDAGFNWRSLNYSIIRKLLKRTADEQQDVQGPRCLIVDDSDLPKTGKCIELIGKVFSHVEHKGILGFKGLFLAFHDGKSLFPLDFSLHGEKGKNKKKPYGLSFTGLKKRFSKKRDPDSFGRQRRNEYFSNKIENMIAMLRRAIGEGIRFDYLLVDSWFTCYKLLKFIKTRRIGCHLLGMIKMGKTRYLYEGKNLTAKQILQKIQQRKGTGRSKDNKFHYCQAVVSFRGIEVKLFFCKATRRAKWRGIMTTDLALEFDGAFKIYSTRWSIEVFFKESKQYLGLGKCESRDFDAQIAHTTICMIQYSILSTAKRFESYETMGVLFRSANADSLEITISERIWLILLEVVDLFADLFDIDIKHFMHQLFAGNEQFQKIEKAKYLLKAA